MRSATAALPACACCSSPRASAWSVRRRERRCRALRGITARVGLGISRPVHDLREIVNAIFYVTRTGIAWEYLPHDFPPAKTVYDYAAALNTSRARTV